MSSKFATSFYSQDSYSQEYPKMLVEYMETKKIGIEGFCVLIKRSPQTVKKWLEKYPEFQAAYELGKAYISVYYQETLRDTSSGDTKGNAAAIQFALKNYDGDNFKDKQEVEHSGNVNYVIKSNIVRPGDMIEDQSGNIREVENLADLDTIEVESVEASEVKKTSTDKRVSGL